MINDKLSLQLQSEKKSLSESLNKSTKKLFWQQFVFISDWNQPSVKQKDGRESRQSFCSSSSPFPIEEVHPQDFIHF